ncbi:MAG: hypothetical protein M3O25_04360, partial [Actinomycetota bacterium]|nr:hypothetical protein [Actinomycetota bacterium]
GEMVAPEQATNDSEVRTMSTTAGHELRPVTSLWWLPLLFGVAALGVGIFFVVSPHETLSTFTAIAGIFVLVDGVIAVVGSIFGGAPVRGAATPRDRRARHLVCPAAADDRRGLSHRPTSEQPPGNSRRESNARRSARRCATLGCRRTFRVERLGGENHHVGAHVIAANRARPQRERDRRLSLVDPQERHARRRIHGT